MDRMTTQTDGPEGNKKKPGSKKPLGHLPTLVEMLVEVTGSCGGEIVQMGTES